MSPIGRIFIVLNLVLAVAFLGWASSALANSHEWKARYEQEVADRKVEVDALTIERDDERRAKETASRDRDDNQQKYDTETATSTQLRSDLAEANRRNDQLRSAVDEIKETLDGYSSRNADLNNTVVELTGKLEASDDERDTFRGERDALETEKNGLERDLTEANNAIAALQKDQNAQGKEIDELTTQLVTLQEIFQVSAKDIMAMPHIKGAVLMTSSEVAPGLVSINRGAADNVQRGFTFEIYAGGQYKGRVRVVEVQENQCMAVVEKLYEGRAIEQGDSASTHI